MSSNRFVIHFPGQLVKQPIIYRLAKEYNLAFNIIMARIMPNEEGLMVAELSGEDKDYDAGIKYLQEQGVNIQLLSEDVSRNEKRCTQCGACITTCPTGALSIPDRDVMEVTFDVEKCIACSLCVPVCPPRAMNVILNGLEGINLKELTR
jgi:ferredoxin